MSSRIKCFTCSKLTNDITVGRYYSVIRASKNTITVLNDAGSYSELPKEMFMIEDDDGDLELCEDSSDIMTRLQ